MVRRLVQVKDHPLSYIGLVSPLTMLGISHVIHSRCFDSRVLPLESDSVDESAHPKAKDLVSVINFIHSIFETELVLLCIRLSWDKPTSQPQFSQHAFSLQFFPERTTNLSPTLASEHPLFVPSHANGCYNSTC